MKWWYWLILELMIIFGVIAWIYFFPSDFEIDFAKAMIGFMLLHASEKCRDINRGKTMSENYTIEQNAGENQIEGGVVSVSGTAKKTELKDQLESYESYINGIPNVIDPCKQCGVFKKNDCFDYDTIKDGKVIEGKCLKCCWFYPSNFEVGV